MSAGRDNKRTDDTKQRQRQLKAGRAVHARLRRDSVRGASKLKKRSVPDREWPQDIPGQSRVRGLGGMRRKARMRTDRPETAACRKKALRW